MHQILLIKDTIIERCDSQGLIHGGDYSFVSLKVRKIRKEVSAMALRFWLSVLARYALCGVARAREAL
jgi:hypothetical protein